MAGVAVAWSAGPLRAPGGAEAWAGTAPTGAVRAAGSWGRSIEVPGAGGYYTDSHGHQQGFVT